MKPTLFDEIRSLSKLEDIISFFKDLSKIEAVLDEIKQERVSLKEQFDQLELGGKAKALDEAVTASEKSLKNALGKIKEANELADGLIKEANAKAAAIQATVTERSAELDQKMRIFEEVKAETEAGLAARDKTLTEQTAKLAAERKEVKATQEQLNHEKERYTTAIAKLEAIKI